MSEIHVFDFDGTLFKSPEVPSWWPERVWWGDPRSLDEPCVPEKPPGDWWISSTVSQAKQSISDQDVYAVLMTGRMDKRFRWRVPELLKMAGLNFDEVHLSPGGSDNTGYFKANILKGLLRLFPFVDRVQVWDDNTKNLKMFAQIVEAAGKEAVLHPVKTPAHAPICTPEDVAARVASRWLVGGGKYRVWLEVISHPGEDEERRYYRLNGHTAPTLKAALDLARKNVPRGRWVLGWPPTVPVLTEDVDGYYDVDYEMTLNVKLDKSTAQVVTDYLNTGKSALLDALSELVPR